MVTRTEWLRAAAFAVVVMALTTIPYIAGYAAQTPAQQFSGFVLAADDSISYIAKMRHGAGGNWQFRLLYTTEPHAAAPLIYLAYILPGQLVGDATTYQTLVAVYHGMRLVFGVLLVLLIYRFIATFIQLPGARLLALVLATLGGGLGILLLPFGATPPEWFIPESFTFLVLLTMPHLALARAAMVGGFLLLLDGRRTWAVLAGGVWLLTTLIVPFYLAVIYAVLGVWGLLLWAKQRAFPLDLFGRAVIAGVITLPLFGYYLWVFSVNPAFAQWSAQNMLPAPPPHHYLLAYAPYLVAGAFAVRRAWQLPGDRHLLLLAWALVGLVLVYLPINVQRRLAEGVIVPLAVLAVMGVLGDGTGARLISPLQGNRMRVWAQAALIITTVPTMLFLLVGATLNATTPALYTSRDTVAALRWLDANALERGAVVLARFEVGNRVPAYTSLRPYVGHGPETLNSRTKEAAADAFFDGDMPPDAMRAFLTENDINYVIFSAGDARPDPLADVLTEVYRAGDVAVYAVQGRGTGVTSAS